MIDCSKSQEMMSLYIDGQLNREDKEALEAHLNQCAQCKEELEILKSMVSDLNEQEFLPLPQGFHEELMEKVNGEKVKQVNFKKANRWKRYSAIAAAFVAVAVIGSAMSQFGGGDMNEIPDMTRLSDVAEFSDGGSMLSLTQFSGGEASMSEAVVAEEAYDFADQETTSKQYDALPDVAESMNQDESISERKKIKTAYLSIEVEGFDDFVQLVETYVSENGGYIEDYSAHIYYEDESSKTSLKAGYIRARVDVSDYSEALDFIKSLGKIDNENEYTEDITSSYVDIQARLGVKIAEEVRLLELMEEAQSIEDIIAIESRIAEVREYIESYEAQLKMWDTRVDYSTIEISIREKQTAAVSGIDSSFGQRIKESFVRSVNFVIDGGQNLIAGLVTISLPVIILVLLGGVIAAIVRQIKKRKK